jgi:hypothetical protein
MRESTGETLMTGYDFNRPFADSSTFPFYTANDGEVASRYGRIIRALEMRNAEYDTRYKRLLNSNNMKPPPSHKRIFGGYLVIRKLGSPDQYETGYLTMRSKTSIACKASLETSQALKPPASH